MPFTATHIFISSARQPWTDKERKDLRDFFSSKWDKCPTKLEIENFKRVTGNTREWLKIKYYVRYLQKEGKTSETHCNPFYVLTFGSWTALLCSMWHLQSPILQRNHITLGFRPHVFDTEFISVVIQHSIPAVYLSKLSAYVLGAKRKWWWFTNIFCMVKNDFRPVSLLPLHIHHCNDICRTFLV